MINMSAIKAWAKALKRDVIALWLAARDIRTPWLAKLVSAMVAAYALSPIDLIPDVIPILGYLDDLVLVPLGIMLAVRLIGPPLMDEFRARAQTIADKPSSKVGLMFVLVVWAVVASACAYFLASYWWR
jgi:uncharacterized membrane protein YkvA (DUF1232 family)